MRGGGESVRRGYEHTTLARAVPSSEAVAFRLGPGGAPPPAAGRATISVVVA